MRPISPGVILEKDFMEPLGMSREHLAITIGYSTASVGRLITGGGKITTRIAFGLAEVFGNSPEFWLSLQMRYDVDKFKDQLKQYRNARR